MLVQGKNGAVVNVSGDLAKALIADGSRAYSATPEPEAAPVESPAPRKRAPRKPKTSE